MNATSPELQQLPPQAVLMQMAMGYMVSQAVSVAARMKIADHLTDGAKTAEQIAGLTESHTPSVYRLMRALSSVGVFAQSGENRFSNTAISDFLRSEHPESLRVIVEMIGSFEHWNAHANMFHSVKTGEIAFDHTFGMPVFPFFAANPESAKLFDAAMTSFSAGIANAVAASYDFSGAETIADIGGGHGILLSRILEANEHAKGILFDQPQVVEGAQASDRIETVGGDFFSEIPVVADVYLMKFILHDWNDEQSISILSNLAKHAPTGSRVLLVETVIEEENVPSMSKVMDLNMLVMTGGKERTATEYSELFEKTGFRLTSVIPTPSPTQIVEAVRV
jgi:hypothetical protein